MSKFISKAQIDLEIFNCFFKRGFKRIFVSKIFVEFFVTTFSIRGFETELKKVGQAFFLKL